MFPKIMGSPKSSIFIGFSIVNHPFWGTPYFWETPIYSMYKTLHKKNRHFPRGKRLQILNPLNPTWPPRLTAKDERSVFFFGRLQVSLTSRKTTREVRFGRAFLMTQNPKALHVFKKRIFSRMRKRKPLQTGLSLVVFFTLQNVWHLFWRKKIALNVTRNDNAPRGILPKYG